MAYKIGDGGQEIGDFTDFLNRKFPSYSNIKRDNKYGLDEAKVVAEAMRRYGLAPTFMDILINGTWTRVEGAIATDEFLVRAGWRSKVKPVLFTVEGHASNMWIGPCADGARILADQKVVYWQPVGYDVGSIPFNNASGVNELVRLVGSATLPDGTPFPAGTKWGVWGFSQGAMIISEFMMKHVIPENGVLHWRLKDFRRGLAIGNPRREKNACAPWAANPPRPDTQGIMDVRFNASQTVVADRWRENATRGDLFAENNEDSDGKNKTAIAKIICENSWFGGESAIFARVIALFRSLPTEAMAAIIALTSAILFAAKNPNPHYATVVTPGDIEWMRGVAS